jgi:hypothetical protein
MNHNGTPDPETRRQDEDARRARNWERWGPERRFAGDRRWQGLVWFYEYFHGDTGRGLGANHQTGWTALVARLLEDCARNRGKPGEAAVAAGR